MRNKLPFIIFVLAIAIGNPVKSESSLSFKLNTEDINGNEKNDVLCFSGKNLDRTATVFDIENTKFKKFWEYILPDEFTGYFTDAVFADLNGNQSPELILIASLENSDKMLFLFGVENNTITPDPVMIAQLPGKYSNNRNPKQAVTLDWDNDDDLEFALSFTSPYRTVLICDYENNEFLVLDQLGEDFLPEKYAPILISSGDLNGDLKDDIVIIDNGIQANARIYMNGSVNEGIRILGLKDVGHLSYLNPVGVDFDGNGGTEIFCASVKTGLHYIFVETIGTTNQAVTVKTELLVKSIEQMYTVKNADDNQIITIHPDGKIGRYNIKSTEGDLSTGIFEITDSKFSFATIEKSSSIYFPNTRELIIIAESESNSEIYFFSHKSYIEPSIDFASQRTDNRSPDIFLEANKTGKISLAWVDTLTFVDFMSNTLSDGMKFSDDGKMIHWTPALEQLGFHDIKYTGHFRYHGDLTLFQEDSLQQIKLEEEIITLTDSLLIYVNDPPNLEENKNNYLTVSGEQFTQKISVLDRNIDKQLSFYFSDEDSTSITVSDSGLVQWFSQPENVGKNNFRLFVSDGIQKDSLDFTIKVHPSIDFTVNDTTFIIQPGKLFTESFQPITVYPFNQYSYSLVDSPENMHVDINGNITWTPIPSQVDNHHFTLKVDDGITSTNLDISVYVNSPPIISTNPAKITYLKKGEQFNFSFKSYDANEDAELSWYLLDGPEGMWMDSTGIISWDPQILDFAEYSIQLSDGYKTADYSGFVYINSIPIITSVPPTGINLGDTLIYSLIAEDKNVVSPFDNSAENKIQYLIIEAPSEAEIINNNYLHWIPNSNQIGKYTIIIAATDGINRVKQNINIFVNHIPDITSSDSVSVEAGNNLIHLLSAQDLNPDDQINFELADTSFNISLEADTIKWSPDNTNLGKHVVTIQAGDGFENSFSKQELTIFVYTNPEFQNIAPTEAFVGVEYMFQPVVNYMGNEEMTNSVLMLESTSEGMTFSENGSFIWTPVAKDVGIQQMTFQAIDHYGLTTTVTFTVGVKSNPYVEEQEKVIEEPIEEPSSPLQEESSPIEEKIQTPSEE